MNRGDGTAEITTGKQLRESARGMIEQTEGGGRFKPTKLRVVT
jgi:hypothetical protein